MDTTMVLRRLLTRYLAGEVALERVVPPGIGIRSSNHLECPGSG